MTQGFREALNTFKYAASSIPAYKHFLKKNKINSKKIKTLEDFKKLPLVDKNNYLRIYNYVDLFPKRKIPPMISMSSGSSGKPFYWARGFKQEEIGGKLHEIIFRDAFKIGKKNTLVIICFSMGTWIAGSFTASSCRFVARKGYNIITATPGIEKEDALSLLRDFAPNFETVILAGYPPFLVDIVVEARRRKINLTNMDMRLLFAGENFSENWRKIAHELAEVRDNYCGSISIYGTADADILGHETPLSIFLRKKAAINKNLAKAIFGNRTFDPTLVQYYPQYKFFESVNGELVFTTNSGIPLIRYNIHDQGKIIEYKDVFKIIKKFGLIKEGQKHGLSRWKMPFLTLGGRSDVAVTFYALNIFPENLKAGLEDKSVSKYFTGKFIAKNKTVQNGKHQQLVIKLELSKGFNASKNLAEKAKNAIFKNLVKLNIEYRKLYASIGQRALPIIELENFGNPSFEVRKSKHRWIAKS